MSVRRTPGWAGALLAALLLGALAVFARANLPSAGFWYDEAMQFWVSRGVDGFAPPNTDRAGSLKAVVSQNARDNLDPVGFSLLLHVWMRGGVDPEWLRILPFGFFLAGLATMARLAWLWRPGVVFALFGAALPLGFPLLVYHATELRAYSMEFAGVTLGCLLLYRLQAGAGPAMWALTGVTLAVFMGSRYSYTIFAASTCAALLPAIRGTAAAGGRARLARLLALGSPVALGLTFVLLNLWLHRGRMTHRGGALIEYLWPWTAADKTPGQLAAAMAANLLSPVAWPVTLGALVALMPARWRARAPAGLLGLGATPEARALYRLAPGVLLLSLLLWRWHPWDVGRKWSLYLHALAAVLLLRMVGDVLAWLASATRAGGRLARWVEPATTALLALVVVGLSVGVATARRTHRDDLVPVLRHLEGVPLTPGSVAVAPHPYAILRYLCEHGPFVGRLPYPAAFRLPYWGWPAPLVDDGTRYLIAYQSPEQLVRAHPGFVFRRDPSRPATLFAVTRADGGTSAGDRGNALPNHPRAP